jgi:hypothetical protein
MGIRRESRKAVIVDAHLFFAGMLLLIVLILVSRQAARHRFGDASLLRDETVGLERWDSLSLELGARVFSSQDLDFVARHCSSEFHRRFREERSALALEWLAQIRSEIDRSMRAHVKTARLNANLKTSDELKLALEYFLFQLSNRILYCAVWVYGPLAAANLVRYSTRLAAELKSLLEIFPIAHSVAAEIIKDDSESSIAS